MRTIRIKLYKFNELSKEAQDKAIMDQIEFESEFMSAHSPYMEVAEKMERMQTPWFFNEILFHTPKYRQMLIDTIEANEYEFTKDGKLNY